MSTANKITLTEENLPSYLRDKSEALCGALGFRMDSTTAITAQQIKGGNLNFSFCVKIIDNSTTTLLFVKQAPDYIAVFGPGAYPLTSERSNIEVNCHKEWSKILHHDKEAWLPNIYYFDDENKVIVMEFLEGQLLDKILVLLGINDEHPSFEKIATSLGRFMGLTHAATHSSLISSDRVEKYIQKFANLELREVQNQYVFTKCYKDGKEAARQAGLDMSTAFLSQVERLKEAYNNNDPSNMNLALLHGDLHPGSVMIVTGGEPKMKVFDQEFAVYGPPGLDVGSLLSGYILAAVTLAYSGDKQRLKEIRESVAFIWDTYKSTMVEKDISTEILKEIEAQAVGYAVAEVCRTALEFAGDRVWLKFDGDKEIQRQAKRAAMRIVSKCMLDRGMTLLLAELDDLVPVAANQRKL